MFRIGEFARFTRVSGKMLRHYDRIGLLRPARVDPVTGYRFYQAAQLARLNRILALRELGFGLDEIGAMLDEPPDDATLARRERELVDTLARTRAQLDAVRALRAGPDPHTDVVLRAVPDQLVATVRAAATADVGPLFVRVEEYVQSQRARATRPPLTLLDAGSVTVAVPLSWPVPAGDGIAVRRLPAVPRMACTVHNGGYAGLPARLHSMLGWLERTGHRPAGPIREVYLRFGAEPQLDLPPAYLADEAADLVTELQVPVT
jgi:DNA-binding transcriptional MerR regulator